MDGFLVRGWTVNKGSSASIPDKTMRSSVLAGHHADRRSSCLFPNRWQALAKHSQIHRRAVNGKVPPVRVFCACSELKARGKLNPKAEGETPKKIRTSPLDVRPSTFFLASGSVLRPSGFLQRFPGA